MTVIWIRPRWAPDGAHLAYAYWPFKGGGRSRAMVADALTGSEQAITSLVPAAFPFRVTAFTGPRLLLLPNVILGEIAVSRDRLFVCLEETSGSIWTLDKVDW